MSDPVTMFMLVVSGLLVVGSVGEQIFARTGVPAVIWLILLGVLVRVTGIVPGPVATALAPFFAALALVMILFDAGRHLTVGAGDEALTPTIRRRALLLALFGFTGTTLLVALISMGLYGLNILPAWGWPHAFMLGSLMSAGAGEVFMPSLVGSVDPALQALLRREAAITKALAVAGTVLCLDAVSPKVVGGAALAMVSGVGFALMFGVGVGVGWIIALQRLADNPRSYMYTLAAMVAAYVMSESAGGSGPLSVLVFGVILGNAERLLALLRRRGEVDPADTSTIKEMLADHEGTIQFVRTLVFAMVGLLLVPPAGPLVFGAVIGFIPLVMRHLIVRFVLASSDHAERSAVGNCVPRGMATVALATLPLAHQVPGSEAMLTLVFSAVTTSVLVFTFGLRHGRATATPEVEPEAASARPLVMRPIGPAVIDVRAPTMREAQREDAVEAGKAPAVSPAPSVLPAPSGEPPVVTGRTVIAGEQPVVTGRTVIAGDRPVDETPLPAAALPPIAAPPVAMLPRADAPVVDLAGPSRTVIAEARPAEPATGTSRTVIAEARPAEPATGASRTVIAEARPRTPLVGMQEHAGGVSAALDREFAVEADRTPEVYMRTLPTIDAARAHGENPLDSAMVRALSKRPEDVNPRGGRTTGDNEVPGAERK